MKKEVNKVNEKLLMAKVEQAEILNKVMKDKQLLVEANKSAMQTIKIEMVIIAILGLVAIIGLIL